MERASTSQLLPQPEPLERTHGVRGEGEGGAHFGKRVGLFEDDDTPIDEGESARGRETPDESPVRCQVSRVGGAGP
jgi:hypothetical protein